MRDHKSSTNLILLGSRTHRIFGGWKSMKWWSRTLDCLYEIPFAPCSCFLFTRLAWERQSLGLTRIWKCKSNTISVLQKQKRERERGWEGACLVLWNKKSWERNIIPRPSYHRPDSCLHISTANLISVVHPHQFVRVLLQLSGCVSMLLGWRRLWNNFQHLIDAVDFCVVNNWANNSTYSQGKKKKSKQEVKVPSV